MLRKDVDPNHEPKQRELDFANEYNFPHTGLIAAPALIENAQIIPVTISAYANGWMLFDIISLNSYIK